MAAIPTTRVATDRQLGSLSLCTGFALYPTGAATAGISAENINILSVRSNPQVLAWRFDIRAGFGFYAGICGPSYATDLTFSGSEDGTNITLDMTDSNTFAGMEMGLGLTFNYYFVAQQWTTHSRWVSDGWHSHWHVWASWDYVAGTSGTMTIDLVWILLNFVIKKYTQGSTLLPSGQVLAARDYDVNTIAMDGTVSLKPEFYVIVDITGFIPAMKPVKEFFEKIGGRIEVGPTINLAMPVTLWVSKARTNGTEYDVSGSQGTNQLTGSRAGDSTVGATAVELEFTHQAGWEFGFGLGFAVSAAKVFSIKQHSPFIDLISLLGFNTQTSPISNSLSATYGEMKAPAYGRVPGAEAVTPYEIVFADAPAA